MTTKEWRRRARKGIAGATQGSYNSCKNNLPHVFTNEWPSLEYNFMWAHGPAYGFTRNIARFIVHSLDTKSNIMRLKKLEDVTFGEWVKHFVLQTNSDLQLIHFNSFNNQGCMSGYLAAHYQTPEDMECMWFNLWSGKGATCCRRGMTL
eukprot:TRINITY_DN3995_c0_g2_i1.p1 TRINITY_DN3995_c0_g2~~TRINITY_DN3995_c0_g2_i1.p1  ORF type:complete len:149 (+),score=25.52 TRINITY_DN3995_c0_g2_i1:278-724(+)